MTASIWAKAADLMCATVGVGYGIDGDVVEAPTAVVLYLSGEGPDSLIVEGTKEELEFILIDALAKVRAYTPLHGHKGLHLNVDNDLECSDCGIRIDPESLQHLQVVRCEGDSYKTGPQHVWKYVEKDPASWQKGGPWECRYCGEWDGRRECDRGA